jgi:hypothetical protein
LVSRYFAHVRSAHGFIRDVEGTELDLATTPRELAMQVAREFQDIARFDYKEPAIVITDELGELVLSLAFEEAVSGRSTAIKPEICGRSGEITSGSEERLAWRTS